MRADLDETSIGFNREDALNQTIARVKVKEESNKLMGRPPLMNDNEAFLDDGRSFFEALFNLAEATAQCLDPDTFNQVIPPLHFSYEKFVDSEIS